MTHCLKTDSTMYNTVRSGKKTFEIRINDRDFKVGDKLILQEWTETSGYSGKEIEVGVTYLIQGKYGLPIKLCIMQIKLLGD